MPAHDQVFLAKEHCVYSSCRDRGTMYFITLYHTFVNSVVAVRSLICALSAPTFSRSANTNRAVRLNDAMPSLRHYSIHECKSSISARGGYRTHTYVIPDLSTTKTYIRCGHLAFCILCHYEVWDMRLPFSPLSHLVTYILFGANDPVGKH